MRPAENIYAGRSSEPGIEAKPSQRMWMTRDARGGLGGGIGRLTIPDACGHDGSVVRSVHLSSYWFG